MAGLTLRTKSLKIHLLLIGCSQRLLQVKEFTRRKIITDKMIVYPRNHSYHINHIYFVLFLHKGELFVFIEAKVGLNVLYCKINFNNSDLWRIYVLVQFKSAGTFSDFQSLHFDIFRWHSFSENILLDSVLYAVR